MKRLLLSALMISALFTSCDQVPQGPLTADQQAQLSRQAMYSSLNITGEVNLEGCDYFVIKNGQHKEDDAVVLVHKGNCKNPIHYENKVNIVTNKDTLTFSR